MRAIILIAILGFVAAAPKNPQRIVGGSVTTIDKYPFQVALLYSSNGVNYNQDCAGSLLNQRSVLSAANCLRYDGYSSWRIRVGSTYANSGGFVHNINGIQRHPSYNSYTNDNDVGLLRSNTAITFSDTVAPVSIAGSNYNLADDEEVWAIGWGTTSSDGLPSEELRHVQMWTVNHITCTSLYRRYWRTITENMLCAGWLYVGGRDQCSGDGGGPLLHNNVVVGITSFGIGCGRSDLPGVNTRVSRYTLWIQRNAI